MNSEFTRKDIAQRISYKWFKYKGDEDEKDERIINLLSEALTPKVNPTVIDMVEAVLGSIQNYSIDRAIDTLWSSLVTFDIFIDHSIDGTVVREQPQMDASSVEFDTNPSPQLIEGDSQGSNQSLILDADSDDLSVDQYSSRTALYPHIPPTHIDLHPEMTLRTGLFRTLPPGKDRPQLNEVQVYELGKALSNGYRYMTIKGSVLDTDLDLTNYLCLSHWFGRMSNEEFENAKMTPLPMTIEKFYSPIPESLRPSSYVIHDHLLASLSRIKSVALTFYPSQADAEGKTKKRVGMVTNLAGTLSLTSDGTIEISPTPELKSLYTSTKRLMPINRSSIIGLPNQMARSLALWLASKPGFDNADWKFFSNIKISAKDLLSEIHKKEKYSHNDLQLLSDALNSLSAAKLVRYDVSFRYSKVDKEKQRLKKLTMTSEITFKAHRLSNSKVFIANNLSDSDDEESLGNPMFPGKAKPRGDSEYKMFTIYIKNIYGKNASDEIIDKWKKEHSECHSLLGDIKFVNGRHISESIIANWMSEYGSKFDLLVRKIFEAYKSHPAMSTLLLKGVYPFKKTAILNMLKLLNRTTDAEMMDDIIKMGPFRIKKSESELDKLIRSLPTKSNFKAKSGNDWYEENKTKVAEIKKLIKACDNPLHELAKVDRRVLNGRLIKPLLDCGRKKEAESFSAMYETGRDSIEDEKVSERNRKRNS